MPEWEFRRWLAYANVRGLPARRLEIQTAIVALTVARCMGGNTSLKLADFLINTEAESKRHQSPDESQSAVSLFAGMAGARRLGRKSRNKRKAN